MELSVVFNELSLRNSAPNREKAREWMSGFVETLTAANDAGLETLRIHADFKELFLSPDYPIVAWYNDDLVPLETRDYLLTYATRHPIVHPHIGDLPEGHPVKKRSEAGFSGGYDGAEALGLSFAYMLNAIAISILTEDVWDKSEVEFERMEEIAEEVTDDRVLVKHIARKDHVNTHRTWVANYYRDLVQDGATMIQYGKFIYPNVVFCARAISQIEALGANHYYFDMLRNEIENMQRYCSEWVDVFFDRQKMGGRTNPESEATLQQYGHQRRFLIPGKGFQIFTWHTRLDRHWRIHFFPVVIERKIYVGYVGEHLDTATG